jgi:hypothetical protein
MLTESPDRNKPLYCALAPLVTLCGALSPGTHLTVSPTLMVKLNEERGWAKPHAMVCTIPVADAAVACAVVVAGMEVLDGIAVVAVVPVPQTGHVPSIPSLNVAQSAHE